MKRLGGHARLCGTRRDVTEAFLPSKKNLRAVSLSLLMFALASGGRAVAQGPAAPFDPVGLWHARVSPTESDPVEFEVRIARKKGALAATLLNGEVGEPFARVSWDPATATLALGLAGDGVRITATPSDGGLSGKCALAHASGMQEFPFSASRKAPPPVAVKKPGVSVAGVWSAEIFRSERSPEKVVARLTQRRTAVTGTIVGPEGGFGPLHGSFDGEQLVLMAIGGDFVHRFTAEILPDGSLAGELRSGASPPVDWRARRETAGR